MTATHATSATYSLHTPFFDGTPTCLESYFLQTLGYQETCQFGDALSTLKQFRARYDMAYKKLADFNAAVKGPDFHEYYDDLVAYLSHRDTRMPGLIHRELEPPAEFLRRQEGAQSPGARADRRRAGAAFEQAAKINAWLTPNANSDPLDRDRLDRPVPARALA